MDVTEPTKKFSGKGHRQHVCKDCNLDQQAQKREKKLATKQATEVALPAPKRYPMKRYQAVSYLGITPSVFDYRRKKLELQPCSIYEGEQGTGFLFDMETIIAVYRYSQIDDNDTE